MASVHFALAECLEKMRYFDDAGIQYRRVARWMPNSYTALKNLYWLALVQDRYGGSAKGCCILKPGRAARLTGSDLEKRSEAPRLLSCGVRLS